MRRKRLNHIVFTICDMFCGDSLFSSYPQLVELGSGTLIIDVLASQCSFNGRDIDQLPIARYLHKWMVQDCATNRIDISLIAKARLTVDIHLSSIMWGERQSSLTETFYVAGTPIKTNEARRCVFLCSSVVQTDDTTYAATCERTREWPTAWPEN